jgi:hypothetical protein
MVGRRFIDFFRRKVKKRTEQRSHGSVSDTQHCKKAYKLAWSLGVCLPRLFMRGVWLRQWVSADSRAFCFIAFYPHWSAGA